MSGPSEPLDKYPHLWLVSHLNLIRSLFPVVALTYASISAGCSLAALFIGLPSFALALGVCVGTGSSIEETLAGEACAMERVPFLVLMTLYSIPLQLSVCVLTYWACLNAAGFTPDELKVAVEVEKKEVLQRGMEDSLAKDMEEPLVPPV